MERDRRAPVATFVAAALPAAGGVVELDDDAAHHARVRRLAAGDPVAVTDGRGRLATGTLARADKRGAAVELLETRDVPPPPAVHLLAPIGDRERMLWLAEKSVELGLTSWRPVLWRRSASVNPRGSGEAFVARVRARMAAALEQCGGAWLPELRDEVRGDAVPGLGDPGLRLLLDPEGSPLLSRQLTPPVTLAVGPEGGLEPAEREALVAAGFTPASLAGNILRFETAGVAALAVVRAALAAAPSGA